jgi:hypothetical protein
LSGIYAPLVEEVLATFRLDDFGRGVKGVGTDKNSVRTGGLHDAATEELRLNLDRQRRTDVDEVNDAEADPALHSNERKGLGRRPHRLLRAQRVATRTPPPGLAGKRSS